jgi:quercetin dioxygenase-like cupin family protein
MSKPLSDIPGKELLMITVEYPPDGSDPVHRHNAPTLIYVLEGSIVMGVNGEKPVTLTAGQTFYEGPTIFTQLIATRARRCQPSSW